MNTAPSIFTRIINGEIPCHKVYEDDKTLAFMDIHPVQEGHVLVVSKTQVDKIYDLPEADYKALMDTVRRVAARVQDILEPARVSLAVVGFDVAHAHVHVVPTEHGFSDLDPSNAKQDVDNEALAALAERLKF
jgi:histidine triad (HIT) family protein